MPIRSRPSRSRPTARRPGRSTNGHNYHTVIPVQLAGPSLLDRLEAAKVSIVASTPGASSAPGVVLGHTAAALARASAGCGGACRRGRGQLQGVLGVGKSRAKIFDTEQPSITFADVAGYDGAKAEIAEVVDFLREPERYTPGGRHRPEGRAHGRSARHRQDPAGPGRRR